MMICWAFVGSVFFAMLVVALEEKRRSKNLINRLRVEAERHQRKIKNEN